jgi:CO/xanthine dehydrogenase Mo-binding subunit
LADIAAELLEAHRRDLRFAEDKVFVQGASQKFKTLADLARYLFQKKGEIVMGKGLFSPPQVRMDEETGAGEPTPCYTYGAAIAEVEVDRETGLLRIVDLVACYDCGRAINPLLTEGQIDGGLVHGIGFTLMENMYPRYPSPDPSAFDLGSYLVPSSKDIPGRVRSIIYESEDPIGPFGAKGVGEVSMNVVAAAVANAVYDAVGVRIKDLPITPERLLKAMLAQRE